MDISFQVRDGGYAGSDRQEDYERFCAAAEECLREWGDDPAYRECGRKLREVLRELENIHASAGHRAALRAAGPNAAGQEGYDKPSEYGGY